MLLRHNRIYLLPLWENTLVKGVFSVYSRHRGRDCVAAMRDYTFSVRSLVVGAHFFIFKRILIIVFVNFAKITKPVTKIILEVFFMAKEKKTGGAVMKKFLKLLFTIIGILILFVVIRAIIITIL